MARRLIAVAVSLVVLAACSSGEGATEATPSLRSGAPATIDPGNGRGHHSKGRGAGERGDASGGSRSGRSDEGAEDTGSSGGDAGDGSGDAGETSSGEGPATAAYPAAGPYVFAQKGAEAFCDPAGNCANESLPPTQKVRTSYLSRDGDEAVVVQEAHMSEGRFVRTTIHFTSEAAFVTEVYYRLQYRGFDISEEYRPDPPVPSVRFPLSDGKEWSATWSADTSGDYRARVAGTEAVAVGGHTVEAYRIETLTHFRGEYKGKASVVIWFDPRTKSIVQTNGALDLKAAYGSYNTTFQTRLQSAPGY